MTVRGAGSVGENRGVISGGYYADIGRDTSIGLNTEYVEGDAVIAKDNATFDNYGIVNVSSFTYSASVRPNHGVIVTNNAVATNKTGGVINVGVNKGVSNTVDGIYVGPNGTFNSEANSEIYIGRTAQYQKTDPTTPIANLIDQVGIRVAAAGSKINHDGFITIGEQVQGATAVKVSNGNANSVANLGAGSKIDILGNVSVASGAPKRNVGIDAENSDGAQITHGGTINVLGTNAVGQNLVAESGRKAKIVNTAASTIVVDESNPDAPTRNYGIYADGEGTGESEAVVDGILQLKGNRVIGAHARGKATLTVNAGVQTIFKDEIGLGDVKSQIAYHVTGGHAVANVADQLNPVDITTQNSTLYLADEGGQVNAGRLNITASGQDVVMLAANGRSLDPAGGAGTASNITTTGGTYALTGSNSKAIIVSGGATADVAGTATVTGAAAGTVIGIADGRPYGWDNLPEPNSVPVDGPTKLVSALNTDTDTANTTGYIARQKAELEYKGTRLNLTGAGSIGAKIENDSTALFNFNNDNATVNVAGDAIQANAGTNSITVDGGEVTGGTAVFNSLSGNNSLTAKNAARMNGRMLLGANARSDVLVDTTSIWNNTDHSTVTTLTNEGTVAFDAPATAAVGNYKTITVTEDYQGGNANQGGTGKLVVNTFWDSDAAKDSDHLIIEGTAFGKTVVSTRSGIIGNITRSTAQQFSSDVVTVRTPQPNDPAQQLGQPDRNAIFTGTANTTNAGQAQLVLKSVGTVAAENVYAWTRRWRATKNRYQTVLCRQTYGKRH